MANIQPQGIETYEGEERSQEELVTSDQNEPGDKAPLIQPPPAYPQPRLAPEIHPQPYGQRPQPYGHVQAQHTQVVVTRQPQTIVYAPEAPAWVGSQWLIIMSVITLLCCGLIPGLIALAISWEARNKRDLGMIEEAKSYSIAAIVCNVVTIGLGVVSIIGAGIYLGVVYSQVRSNTYPY